MPKSTASYIFKPVCRERKGAELCTQHGGIKLDFRSFKMHIKMDMLWCKSPDMVKKEIAVYLLACNFIRANMA